MATIFDPSILRQPFQVIQNQSASKEMKISQPSKVFTRWQQNTTDTRIIQPFPIINDESHAEKVVIDRPSPLIEYQPFKVINCSQDIEKFAGEIVVIITDNSKFMCSENGFYDIDDNKRFGIIGPKPECLLTLLTKPNVVWEQKITDSNLDKQNKLIIRKANKNEVECIKDHIEYNLVKFGHFSETEIYKTPSPNMSNCSSIVGVALDPRTRRG